jgi:hypothetical protein
MGTSSKCITFSKAELIGTIINNLKIIDVDEYDICLGQCVLCNNILTISIYEVLETKQSICKCQQQTTTSSTSASLNLIMEAKAHKSLYNRYNVIKSINKHRCSEINSNNPWMDRTSGYLNYYEWIMKQNGKEPYRVYRYDTDKQFSPDNCYLYQPTESSELIGTMTNTFKIEKQVSTYAYKAKCTCCGKEQYLSHKAILSNKRICRCQMNSNELIEQDTGVKETKIKTDLDAKLYTVYSAMRHTNKRFRIINNDWMNLDNGFENFKEWALFRGFKEGCSIKRRNTKAAFSAENCYIQRPVVITKKDTIVPKKVYYHQNNAILQ